MHILVELAKKAIHEFVTKRVVLDPPLDLTDEMKVSAGAFVSLKKHGNLRGCIGTFLPTKENLAKEIISNAISASTKDPRFSPVDESELLELTISVDVLTSPEFIETLNDLNPKKYGIIVKSGFKNGLLLPDLEGVDTVEEQLNIVKRKAGIDEGEDIEISRFEVVRYK